MGISDLKQDVAYLKECYTEFQREMLKIAAQHTAICESLLAICRQVGADELDIYKVFDSTYHKEYDQLLRKFSDIQPALAAKLDIREIDQIPTDD